jgi:hypothetical protein
MRRENRHDWENQRFHMSLPLRYTIFSFARPKVTDMIHLIDQLSYAFGSKDSRLGRRWRQGLGSVLHL